MTVDREFTRFSELLNDVLARFDEKQSQVARFDHR